MSLLYKENPKLFLEVSKEGADFIFEFTSDCGKHGTIEGVDFYRLSPERLIKILQDREDYTDKELE